MSQISEFSVRCVHSENVIYSLLMFVGIEPIEMFIAPRMVHSGRIASLGGNFCIIEMNIL
jgi:hypothetical protein